MKIITLFLFLAFGLGLPAASAMEMKKPAGRAAPLVRSYVWYDGDKEKRVWLNPSLAVEFDPGPIGDSPLKKEFPSAKEMISRTGAIRIWKLQGGVKPEEAVLRLKSIHPEARYSPVMHDSPAGTGRKRALPGNVIVYLNPAWDETAVQKWAGSRRLEIVKKLEIGPNVFVLKTGPGLESLETANALYHSGEVVAAIPDWWQEAVTR
jgi:hypothetical protein